MCNMHTHTCIFNCQTLKKAYIKTSNKFVGKNNFKVCTNKKILCKDSIESLLLDK